jgi:hypothetical protein
LFYYIDDLLKEKVSVSPQKYYPSFKYIDQSRYKSVGIGKSARGVTHNPSTDDSK